ncbi:diguanylate cyclase [Clostridium botulinum]|nr:diguanylate cyclase [Clostridium botulinum]
MTIILLAVILVLIISNLTLIVYVSKLKKSNASNNDTDNMIIKEILDKVSTNEFNFIDSSAINIIDVLKKNYSIDYCTILIKKQNILNIIASDVEKIYQEEIVEHCSELLSRTKGRAIINSAEETYLGYKSATRRAIKYSYFLPLGSIGALYIENYDNYVNNNFEVEFFNVVMKNIGIILQNCVYQDTISNLAMKDNLTNLYNRNYMNKHIEMLKKKNVSLVIAIMDIDHFKNVNDTYGHDFGDVVLKQCSNYIKDHLDYNDEIYRWGGEEFIISFLNQDISTVLSKLNIIREGLSGYSISDGKTTIKITASFGVATLDENQTLEEGIKKADNGLYISKENGRNQVNVV